MSRPSYEDLRTQYLKRQAIADAVANHDVDAMLDLAIEAYKAESYSDATGLWKIVAGEDHPRAAEAAYNYALFCEKGLSDEPGIENANVYYKRAADNGHAAAQNNYGLS